MTSIEHKQIDPEVMREMLKAAEGMGVGRGQQDFQGQAINFSVVDAFSTHFGRWAEVKDTIIAQVFPRLGPKDVYYDGRANIPGRLEIRPKDAQFPQEMRGFVENACHKVTLGDVQMDYVPELGAYVVRFCDVQPVDKWLEEGGFLEQFFTEIDRQLDAGGKDG